MKGTLTAVAAAVVAVMALGAPAQAQDRGEQLKDALKSGDPALIKNARQELREDRRELREDVKDRRDDRRELREDRRDLRPRKP